MAVLSACSVLPPCFASHFIVSNPTVVNALYPRTAGIPSAVQGVGFIACCSEGERPRWGSVWASQYGGVREDLQGVDLIWSDPSWSQSGLV